MEYRRAVGAAGKRPAMGHRLRRLALGLVAIFATVLLVGCGSDDAGSGPDVAANALVSALAAGTQGDMRITNETASVDTEAYLAEVLRPLLDASNLAEPPVQVASVSAPSDGNREGSTATATLNWSWPLADGVNWDYQTTAELVFTADAVATPGGGANDEAGWAVQWSPAILVPDLAPAQRVKVLRSTPPRASILDGDGVPLVEPRPVWRIGIDKTLIPAEQWEDGARALVALIDQAGYTFDADAYVGRVAAAGERAFVELITLRQENSPVSRSEVEQVPGGRALDQMKDLAPTAEFARALLGNVGEATAEIIENSGGEILAGDMTGLSGLQKTYNARLAGTPGYTVQIVTTDGSVVRDAFASASEDGIPIATALHKDWQLAAERLLAGVAPAAAIVAIEPSSGAVRVAANGPGSAGYNTALLGQYPPGSTFKVADALALRRAGLNADSIVPCTESINVAGRVFQNVPGYPTYALGDVPLRVAFANSCNTAFVSQLDTITPAALKEAAADLGIGVATPIGVGAEFGSVPESPGETEHAADLLGQGLVTASPFAMARLAASVAAGHRVDPILVEPLAGASADNGGEPIPVSNLTSDEAAFLRELMAGVVAEGSATILQDVPGIVGAKTGTAQFGDGSQNHTWMIAIAGDLAVAVFVEEGEFGSTTSGPIMAAFLHEVLG